MLINVKDLKHLHLQFLNFYGNAEKKIMKRLFACKFHDCGIISNLILICILRPSNKAHFAPVGKYRSDGITETVKVYQKKIIYFLFKLNFFLA